MSRLEEARARIAAQEHAAQEAREKWEQEEELRKRDFESLKPELERIELEFWRAHVPVQLTDLYSEVRRTIEEKEGFQMDEVIRFYYGEYSLHHEVVRYSSGKQENRWDKMYGLRDDAVGLWREGKLAQIPLRSVSLEYIHSKRAGDSETVNRIHFEVGQDDKATWTVGDGKKYFFDPERGIHGNFDRDGHGKCGTSNSDIDLLAELMIPFINGRQYHYGIDHSPGPKDRAGDDGSSGGPGGH
ncbi:MAG: hypothetical protein A3F04_02235 [Candidatus Chisholmbacteria bacterium RIFCSPHIGHO2_12_FULL_49_9]|uniref:Uncharacterized protein n=1 Tax=Candidatus Chisholmbacteria bacterium RIFCSPHIGHO2_01_FULL_52_32 TaxID=1797591 RepID=A0A1G1VRV3_9BACT|nr:MAG: hypothetical protein A2786_01335 [Candidatus Chisholmbacteria bacterium RIFCSPHIGHO2_01_FULL_52_32]OGY19254.1 MAG: hypothetical protein A3F04_02235 [Candidatus Chisholmbacteria bacterium RIFCSPHIGHO2_12_FULL_49_9]OGY20482.1 MAG: hypothetical protein A2900_05410 [Candidatus Chisholmbacteria bacterium RIFCSPLOWO2_01_FULL_50_28]